MAANKTGGGGGGGGGVGWGGCRGSLPMERGGADAVVWD